MQTQRIHRLERVLTLTIALALVFAGLCIYVYLVEVYESHWVSTFLLYLAREDSFVVVVLTSRCHTAQGTPRPTSFAGWELRSVGTHRIEGSPRISRNVPTARLVHTPS
jgi:hypothetical protein